MTDSLKTFFKIFGGVCFVHFTVEFPYSLFQGEEFNLSARRLVFYLIFSFGYAAYKYYSSNKDNTEDKT
jgi:hypothetical protein